ncbi:MAG: type I 3-dehydroquinate dehydratase [Bacteroidales bacterium]|nr:type I 3-dehydroquinate dehydratase [Bacteroidales bacterium]
MICTSIQNKNYEEIIQLLGSEDIELAEIRLDLCTLNDEEIKALFSEFFIFSSMSCLQNRRDSFYVSFRNSIKRSGWLFVCNCQNRNS